MIHRVKSKTLVYKQIFKSRDMRHSKGVYSSAVARVSGDCQVPTCSSLASSSNLREGGGG